MEKVLSKIVTPWGIIVTCIVVSLGVTALVWRVAKIRKPVTGVQ